MHLLLRLKVMSSPNWRRIATTACAATLLGFAHTCAAQIIESMEWIGGTGQATARIQFPSAVQFLGQIPTGKSQQVQVSFQFVGREDTPPTAVPEVSKRLAPTAGAPEMLLTYVAVQNDRRKNLLLNFPIAVRASAKQGPSARSIDVVVQLDTSVEWVQSVPETPAAKTTDATSASAAAISTFGVVLKTLGQSSNEIFPRIPAELQDYIVGTRTIEENGNQVSALFVGYFPTEQEARALQSKVVRRFPEAHVVRLARTDQRSNADASATADRTVRLATPADKEQPDSSIGTPLGQAASLSIDARARELLQTAQKALADGRAREAVEALNQALLLPPNADAQEAQELIGQGWEALHQEDKARIEYQLYLRLYPQAPGAQRVADRLARLGPAPRATPQDQTFVAPDVQSATSRYSGSISQYYFGGQSRSESLVNVAAGIDQNTLTLSNQSALVTSLDLAGNFQSAASEVKLVLRDTASKNFIASSNAASTLTAAYVDYRNLASQMELRVGRQTSVAGSLFGLFDGVSAGLPFAGKYKLDAMAGVPANTLVSAPSQTMAGIVVEADSLAEHWNGNVSLVDQTTEGISDRRAMGLDLRYFGDGISAYAQVDYDLNFGMLNAATLMGTMQGPGNTSVTFMLDDRRAPSLQLSDALISTGTMSLSQLLQLHSLSEVQTLALGTAAQARQALLSFSRPLTEKWQASLDLRYNDIGALPAIGNFQAMPATGAQYNVSVQLTGTNLYSTRDINGINLSAMRSDTLNGYQIAYNNLTSIWGNKASVEPSIRIYAQSDNTDTKILRIAPGMRLTYKLSDRTDILGEVLYERSQTDGPLSHDQTTATFFYVGYRHDIF